MMQALFTMTKAETMNAHSQFCPNPECKASGKSGVGNIVIHGQKRQRYKCTRCRKTFSAQHGTMYAGLRSDVTLVVIVVTLLAYGCPVPAIVQAYGLDERTVADWRDRAGRHCQRVHEAVVQQGQLELEHVQADEIRIKGRQWVAWQGMAIMVRTRLWLGGVVQEQRNRSLANKVMQTIRACAKSGCALLVATDGWAAYPKAILRTFRRKVPRQGRIGRCRLQVWETLGVVRIVKQTTEAGKSVFNLTRQILRGSAEFVGQQLTSSHGGIVINTAFIERLNATFRQRLAPLTRRTHHAAKRIQTLHAAMFLLGTTYNFCTVHCALRQPNFDDPTLPRWLRRTPAMAAGLTDHVWSIHELLAFKSAPPPLSIKKPRGRPKKLLPISSTT